MNRKSHCRNLGILGVLLLQTLAAAFARQPADSSRYPAFSWNTVPVAAFVGKTSAPLTRDELTFLTDKFPIVFLSNAHNMRKMKTTEAGIAADAQRIKAMNPATKVFFYWNSFISYENNYEAGKTFAQHDDWALRDLQGNYVTVRNWKRYDHTVPALREWWSGVAAQALKNPALDGVFIDAIPQLAAAPKNNARIWGAEKQAQLEKGLRESLELLRKKAGNRKLIIYNGMRGRPGLWPDGGSSFLDFTDGAMVEHFAWYGKPEKRTMARDLEIIAEAGKKGKMIIVKGWPQFTWLDTAAMKKPRQELRQLARAQLIYPLACFLLAAGPYSYFCYSWGYRDQFGTFDWYPEFDKPLGKPLGDAVKKGWQYTRRFEHATVTANLDNTTANIEWIDNE